MIFVSHHGVLDEPWGRRPELYRILNPGLEDMLRNAGVQICLSGHQHFPSALISDDILQIVSPMPLTNAFVYNDLVIKGKTLEEKLVPIRFDERMVPLFTKKHARSFEFRLDAVNRLFRQMPEKEKMERITSDWFFHMENGTLKDFKKHMHEPVYRKAMHMLGSSDFGSWMNAMMQEPYIDPSHIIFQLH